MRADILKAFYRNTKSKKDEIYRIEANGQVVIRNLVKTFLVKMVFMTWIAR